MGSIGTIRIIQRNGMIVESDEGQASSGQASYALCIKFFYNNRILNDMFRLDMRWWE